jgi:hypothetical protein
MRALAAHKVPQNGHKVKPQRDNERLPARLIRL